MRQSFDEGMNFVIRDRGSEAEDPLSAVARKCSDPASGMDDMPTFRHRLSWLRLYPYSALGGALQDFDLHPRIARRS